VRVSPDLQILGDVLECGMNRPVSIALLAVGILLIIFGLNAGNSLASSVSRFFTGSPTDKAIWLLIGGILASIVGLVGLVRGKAT
jgi:hypothetical protein